MILAVGFGREEAHPTYWEDDGLDSPNAKSTAVLISGAGDGGLTDLFRACIRDFRHDEILNFVDEQLVRVLEPFAKTGADSEQLRKVFTQTDTKHLVERLRLRRRNDTEVTLNDSGDWIFRSGTSLLNCTLTHLLSEAGMFTFVSGMLRGSTGGSEVEIAGQKRVFDRVILRHGPKPALRESFPTIYDALDVQRKAIAAYPNALDKTRFALWGPSDFSIPSLTSTSVVAAPQDGAASEEPPKAQHLASFPSRVSSLLKALEDGYHFRWEPQLIPAADDVSVAYWPVRLRQPTPIHALQAFAAAALQKSGVKIELYIDDLGTEEYSAEAFKGTVLRWIRRVGGKQDAVRTTLLSDVVSKPEAGVPWMHAQNWLGRTDMKLERVLGVAKLLPDDRNIETLLLRRPRRLLTPAVVWAGLSDMLQVAGPCTAVTLGGFDERPLWESWRQCAPRSAGIEVGHLYIPELKPPNAANAWHMDSKSLAWTSKQDIRQSLTEATTGDEFSAQLSSAHGLLGWSYRGCVLLPAFVESNAHAERPSNVEELATLIQSWVL